jgi:hypothetical protein
LLGELFLRSLFGLQQALGGVGGRDGALAFVAQLGDFDPQLGKFFLRIAVEPGDALAELEGPQRTGQGRRLRTIMRGALIDRRRRRSFRRMLRFVANAPGGNERGRVAAASSCCPYRRYWRACGALVA